MKKLALILFLSMASSISAQANSSRWNEWIQTMVQVSNRVKAQIQVAPCRDIEKLATPFLMDERSPSALLIYFDLQSMDLLLDQTEMSPEAEREAAEAARKSMQAYKAAVERLLDQRRDECGSGQDHGVEK